MSLDAAIGNWEIYTLQLANKITTYALRTCIGPLSGPIIENQELCSLSDLLSPSNNACVRYYTIIAQQSI
jgi:hypothetical protein